MTLSSTARQIIFWLLIIAGAVLLYQLVNPSGRNTTEIDLTTLYGKIDAGDIKGVTVQQNQTVAVDQRGQEFKVQLTNEQMKNELFKKATELVDGKRRVASFKDESATSSYWPTLLMWAPLLFIIAIWIFMLRQMQSGGNKALSFGKSRAKLLNNQQKRVTFKDVAGVEEAKEELQEIIEFLKEPQKFQKLGGRIPKGVLMMGPPGTGKTLLARAIAGEANVPFFSISGSDFVEMFVGVGASRVRDMFEQGKKNAPCIIFIDEIEAVGRHRGAGLGGGHDEREQTLNQVLVEMDGFETNTNVIVIAATNRPDVLDPALLRPGRFDRQVIVDSPDLQGRAAILEVHVRGKPLEEDVSIEGLARQTPGFSGADLENLVNEAAILAARRNKKVIGMSEFQEALDRVIAGPQRKSRVISERERIMTAYHEAGHALVARMLPNADPVRKVSIVARGMMGGYTRVVPDEDRLFKTKAQFEDELAVYMAGQVAENMVFEEQSTGAA